MDIIADGYIPQGQAYVMIKDNTTSEINSIESGEIILDPSHSYSVTISLERGKGSIQCFGDGTHSPCGYTEDHYSEISGTIFVYGLAGPTISQGPKDLEVYSHEQAEFTIQGENISSYCWQVSTSEGYTDLCDSIDSEGVSYSGVKSSTLHISNVSIDQNGKKYRCVLTDSEGTSLESEAATLTVLQNTSISVIIPKKIVLSGSEKEGEYLVRVSGFLPKDRSLTVAPNTASFILTQDGKEPIVPLLYQDITAFSPSEEGLLDREARGKISAKELSAGIWNGSFYFDISLS
ncbi:MAG: immunoglobulin domain-containing protein [Lachnospiraceae bacterium]|nr:immunoglobulin domain-containing protein [Lachnospiraceae bacterium]